MAELNFVATSAADPTGANGQVNQPYYQVTVPGYTYGDVDNPTGDGFMEYGSGTPGSLPFRVDQAGNVTAGGIIAPAGLQPSGDSTGVTDTANIQGLLNLASPGAVVQLAAGTFVTNAPLLVPSEVGISGPAAVAFGNAAYGAVIMPSASWAQGTAAGPGIILMTVPGSGAVGKQFFLNFTIDGSNLVATGVHGIMSIGAIGAVTINGVNIRFVTGIGLNAAADGSGNVAGDVWRVTDLNCYRCGQQGIYMSNASDSFWTNVYTLLNGTTGVYEGWYYAGSANSSLIGCRSEDNTGNGIILAGPTGSGSGGASSLNYDSVRLIGCGTQTNFLNGLVLLDSYTGASNPPAAQDVIVSGCSFDGDGTNNGSGGGGYAGILVNGHQILTLDNTDVLTCTIAASGSPQYAIATSVSATGSRTPVSIRYNSGLISAVTALYNDAAPSGDWFLGSGVSTYIGTNGRAIASFTPGAQMNWSDADMGFAAQAFDLASSNFTGRAPTLGVHNLIGMWVRKPVVVSTIRLILQTNGGTLTTNENFVSLLSSTGAVIGYSADQTTAWGSGSVKTVNATLTAESAGSLSLQPGYYWVDIITNGSSAPQFASNSNVSAGSINGRLSNAASRYATQGTSVTAVAAITPSSNTQAQISFWAGLY